MTVERIFFFNSKKNLHNFSSIDGWMRFKQLDYDVNFYYKRDCIDSTKFTVDGDIEKEEEKDITGFISLDLKKEIITAIQNELNKVTHGK